MSSQDEEGSDAQVFVETKSITVLQRLKFKPLNYSCYLTLYCLSHLSSHDIRKVRGENKRSPLSLEALHGHRYNLSICRSRHTWNDLHQIIPTKVLSKI